MATGFDAEVGLCTVCTGFRPGGRGGADVLDVDTVTFPFGAMVDFFSCETLGGIADGRDFPDAAEDDEDFD